MASIERRFRRSRLKGAERERGNEGARGRRGGFAGGGVLGTSEIYRAADSIECKNAAL